MPFKMMHAFETVYNKDTLPCLCFAKTGSVPNASAPWNIELVPPTALSAQHPSTRPERVGRARVSRVSRRVRDPNAYRRERFVTDQDTYT